MPPRAAALEDVLGVPAVRLWDNAPMGWNRWATTVLLLALLGVCVTILAVRFAVLARRVPVNRVYSAAAAGTALAGGDAPPEGAADVESGDAFAGAAAADAPDMSDASYAEGDQGGAGRAHSKSSRQVVLPTPGHKLDINTATAAQLDRLPGIGPVLAKRIVDYRTRFGSFRRVDDLDKVKGIGPAKLAKIRDYVCIKPVS